MGYGRRIGSTALTGLIAEESTLHSLRNGYAHRATHGCVHPEGFTDDEGEHGGYLAQVQHDDDKSQQRIAHGHDGNHDAGETRDAFHASEDDDKGGQREGGTYPAAVNGKGVGEGIAEGIALHYLVGHAKGNGDEYGKEDAHPLAVKTVLHVIGGTSVEGVCPTLLVQLGQGGLDKGRCGTKEGHHPHPEHGPGTAHEDGGGHTGQIARTDTAGQ